MSHNLSLGYRGKGVRFFAKYVLTNTNAAAANVTFKLICDDAQDFLMEYFKIGPDDYGAARQFYGYIKDKNGDVIAYLFARSSDNEPMYAIPYVRYVVSTLDEKNEGVTQESFVLSGQDYVYIVGQSLAQNETITIFVRGHLYAKSSVKMPTISTETSGVTITTEYEEVALAA